MDEDLLIVKAKAGDQKAIELLLHTYHVDIRKFAKQVCKNNEDMEDAVQYTLLTIFQKLEYFKGLSKFSTWVFAIVKNECLRLMRKLNHVEKNPVEETFESSPELKLSQLEIQLLVSNEISQLDPIYREIIILRDVMGSSTAEVSGMLSISSEAVKGRLHRARSIVRDQLILQGFKN